MEVDLAVVVKAPQQVVELTMRDGGIAGLEMTIKLRQRAIVEPTHLVATGEVSQKGARTGLFQ